MARHRFITLTLALLGTMIPWQHARAQFDRPLVAPATAFAEPADPDVLPDLPRPPAQPASLLQQPINSQPYTCGGGPSPCYFEPAAILDAPPLPPPGWVGDVEIGILQPHVRNQLSDTVLVGARTDTVDLSSARLNWNAAPRFELGRRLPSGFGEFDLSYRFLNSTGTGQAPGLDTSAILKSRYSLLCLDLDYANNELTLRLPNWSMKWRFGLQTADVFFDSVADEPLLAAATGSGVFEQSETNNFWGIGPHAAVELTRSWGDSPVRLCARLDGAMLWGQLHQRFNEVSVNPAPGGGFITGQTNRRDDQDVPVLNAYLGLDWRPPDSSLHVVAGYQYEIWWKVGENELTGTSFGEAVDQGALLRLEYNY
jgi:hypothetical protein